ncbi:hypothetical protein HK102_008494 [Quaeritorhiza haematococci]|nr:hypothetical protein HK102_008494 [Quaeritorhiza haematococci]
MRRYLSLLVLLLACTTAVKAWEVSSTLHINAPKSKLWQTLSTPTTWPQWDTSLSHVVIHSQPSPYTLEGVRGTLYKKSGACHDFEIHDTNPQTGYFAVKTEMFGVQMDWYFDFGKEVPYLGVDLKEGVKCTGWLSWGYGWFVKGKTEKAVKETIEGLKRFVESK